MSAPSHTEILPSPGRAWIGWLGALLFFCVALTTLPRIGVGYDEAVHSIYGELVLKFIQTGGADRRCMTYNNLMFYGPWVDTLTAFLYGGEGSRNYPVRHVVSLFFAALTLPAVFYLGRATGAGWPAGLAAMLAMALMPRFMGHGLFNTKDVPFGCLFAWSLAWVWAIRGQLWRLGWREAVGLGLLAGLAMGIRVGGLLIFAVLGVAAALGWGQEVLLARKLEGRRLRETLVALGWWAFAFAIAYALMIAVWPWAWDSPLTRPMEAMREFSKIRKLTWLLFDGRVVSSLDIPGSYVPVHLLLGTPLVWLGLASLGLGSALAAFGKPLAGPRGALAVGTLVWLFLPLVYVLVGHPVLYGSARQFMFILPGMAALAGQGFALLWRRFPGRRTWLWGGLATGTLWAGWGVLSLHPYEYVYYNEFAGDMQTLGRRFELDDWCLSYREAALWLNAHADPGGKDGARNVLFAGSEYNVDCLGPFLAPDFKIKPYLPSSFGRLDESASLSTIPPGTGYYVAFTDVETQRVFPQAPVVHQIKAGKTVICEIRGHSAGATGGTTNPD